MILPKPHLSFSQMFLWEYSKETYRKKYYPKITPHFATSPAMAFGNHVTEAMERGEEFTRFIPRYPVFEYNPSDEPDNPDCKTLSIGGVPIMGFIDNMNMNTIQFSEQKTGVTPWTQNKVNKHFQLDLYSLLLYKQFGRVEDECFLIWVKTAKQRKTVMMGDIELEGNSTEIILTGEFEVFSRIITQEDRDAMEARVIRIGREIEEDFAAMKKFYN